MTPLFERETGELAEYPAGKLALNFSIIKLPQAIRLAQPSS